MMKIDSEITFGWPMSGSNRISSDVYIGFTGTQCTGKSEQANLLAHIEGFEIIRSPGRQLRYDQHINVNKEGTLSSQVMITGKMEELTHRELSRKNAHENTPYSRTFKTVFERTHVDIRAYTLTSDLTEEESFNMSETNRQLAINQFDNLFDLVFYFEPAPVEWYQYPDDGVRDTNITYRLKVDELIRAELFETGYYDTSKIITLKFDHPYRMFANIVGAIERKLYPEASESNSSLAPTQVTRATDESTEPSVGGST
jgi:AAA domain